MVTRARRVDARGGVWGTGAEQARAQRGVAVAGLALVARSQRVLAVKVMSQNHTPCVHKCTGQTCPSTHLGMQAEQWARLNPEE